MKSKIGYYTTAVLLGGLVALFGPWLLLHPEVGLPHWLSFFAFGLVGGSARLARTVGERRGGCRAVERLPLLGHRTADGRVCPQSVVALGSPLLRTAGDFVLCRSVRHGCCGAKIVET